MNKTHTFRSLHQDPKHPLILANAWDAASARIVESLGAPAVATSSAAVAWALGYPDGGQLPPAKLALLAESIVNVVNVPVSFDVEGGYSDDPATVVENLKPVFDAGVVGINIEDGSGSSALLARKIEAIKAAAAAMKIDVFVNARTDVYLADLVTDGKKVEETLVRAKAYQDAGADGLFVPCLTDVTEIGYITRHIELPVNLMVMPGLPKASVLAQLNVRRLSAGGALSKLIWAQFASLSKRFLAEGESKSLVGESMGYSNLQKLFTH